MQVIERYFIVDPAREDSSYCSSSIRVELSEVGVLQATTNSSTLEVKADPERARRIAREVMVKRIMATLQERLFGA